MNKLILLFGLVCVLAGVLPLPQSHTKSVSLRIHQVHHLKCTRDVCKLVNRE